MSKVHEGLILLKDSNAILRKDYVNLIGKVKLISGGKTENESIYSGFIGPGMLTAAIVGNTVSAPSVDNILKVIKEIGSDRSSGILLIIQNYAEYSINFTLAKLYAEEKGYIVKLITISSNNMCDFGNTITEQDFLPILFIYKIAGAMSEEGKSIDEIYTLCNSVANSGEIILLKTDFENIIDEEHKLKIFTNITKKILEPLIDILNIASQQQTKTRIHESKTFCISHEIVILIFNFGCSKIQKNIFILELLQQLEINGLKVKRIYVKDFMMYSEKSGFHICLLNLSFTVGLIKYLDFPTSIFSWPTVLTLETIETRKNMDYCDLESQGPIMNHETGQAFLSVISMACETIITCTKLLDKIGEEYGNRDYGTSLARGAKAIQHAIQKNKILGTNLYITFTQISHIIQNTVNGLQGKLYFLFFHNIAKAFLKYQSDKKVTAGMWLHALIIANKAIEQFKVPSMYDHSFLITLTTMQRDLENALNRNVDPIDAFGIAVKAAENFTTSVLYTQNFHVKNKKFKSPNPQAHAIGIWMRAAYEGTKLKLMYCNTK